MNIKFKIGVTALATEIDQDNQTSLYDIEEDSNTIYDS